jgi:signal transduction histidine kinase
MARGPGCGTGAAIIDLNAMHTAWLKHPERVLKSELWQRFKRNRFGRAVEWLVQSCRRIILLLRIPAPEVRQLVQRIDLMERNIILPLKVAGILMLLYSFYVRSWFNSSLSALDIAVDTTKSFLWIYIGANLLVAVVLLCMYRLPLPLVQWSVFAISLVDGIFLSVLTMLTGGYDSFLYWLFLGLIVRAAVSVPHATSQIMLNCTLIACYVMAGVTYISVARYLGEDFDPPETLANPTQPLLLRLVLMLLMTICCYGVQVLLERQRLALEEAREFAAREGQLHSAGRLAAEFAHQIKNPLAIINNAAFSLQRALKEGKPIRTEQIQIIQEEVERSDRIVTDIMGYAQLSEGHVEKLNVNDEIDFAISRVFPAAAGYAVQIHRQLANGLPPLFMQRRHLSDTLINLLQNAREALGGKSGNIYVSAQNRGESQVEIIISDDGPGIAPEKQKQIFEAYYTTKKKGTGLGLATVKHNVELYSGSVKVESALGKGARFILLFPVKALFDAAK